MLHSVSEPYLLWRHTMYLIYLIHLMIKYYNNLSGLQDKDVNVVQFYTPEGEVSNLKFVKKTLTEIHS